MNEAKTLYCDRKNSEDNGERTEYEKYKIAKHKQGHYGLQQKDNYNNLIKQKWADYFGSGKLILIIIH